MTYTLVSLVLFFLAAVFLSLVLLAPVAILAGNVLHIWGAASAWEWALEALRRVFAGSIRRRFMRAVNAQRDIAVDRSRRTCSHIAVSISTADVHALAGPGGALERVAADAASGYLRYARAAGLDCTISPQVVVVPEDWLRRGSVKARPVAAQELAELWLEMLAWDQGHDDVERQAETVHALVSRTVLLADADETVSARLSDSVTERFDPAGTTAASSSAPRLVLTDTLGARHTVRSESVIIGRGDDCEFRFDSPEVSREHAIVYFQEGTWWLRDRGSRNGTTVDGEQARGSGPVRLYSGSRVVLGSDAAGEKLTIAEAGQR
jgi:hypothetical protein